MRRSRRDLPQLLAADGERLPHAAAPPRAVRRRRGTRPRATARPARCDSTATPARAQARARRRRRRRRRPRSTACTAVPNRLVFSTSGMPSSDAHRFDRLVGAHLDDRPSREDPLQLGRRAERREPAGVDERDAMAALGLVQVVRRDEHGDARLRRACRSAARTGGATADRRRRSARRERGSAARGGSRSRARGAGASRRRDRARACARGRRGRPSRARTGAARSSAVRVEPVDAAEEADVLIDREQLVEREALRHVADAPLDAFGIAPTRRCRRQSPCRDVGLSSPHSMRIVVDLPAPLLPRKPKISPRAHVERHVVDGDEVAEAAGQVLDLDGDGGSGHVRLDPGLPSDRALASRASASRAFASARVRSSSACSSATARRARRCSSRRRREALADDAACLRRAARTPSAAATMAARLESSSSRRWRTSKATWRSKSATRDSAARAVAAASARLRPAAAAVPERPGHVDRRRPTSPPTVEGAGRCAGSGARSRSRRRSTT